MENNQVYIYQMAQMFWLVEICLKKKNPSTGPNIHFVWLV